MNKITTITMMLFDGQFSESGHIGPNPDLDTYVIKIRFGILILVFFVET